MEPDANCQLARGHTYSGIFTQDNARVHLGDVHSYGNASTHSHNYYICSSSSDQPRQSFTLCGHGGIASSESELLSLKRKRPSDENEYPHIRNKEESLVHVLSKLGKFSKSIQDQKADSDAKKISRRIALVLNAVKHRTGNTERSLPRKDGYINHEEDDFERIDSCLVVAKRVDINTGFQRTKHTKLTRITRKCDEVTFEQWVISLRTSTFEFRNEDGTEAVESLSVLSFDTQFFSSGPPITVHVGETTTHTAVSFINPVVFAYRVVPTDSEVFKVIKNDDVAGLMTLLAEGTATLRDCTNEGETLLHVSECSKHHGYRS
jgi:ATP-dependent Clp protease adapter protein ClpS